jgi:hypothetical protein
MGGATGQEARLFSQQKDGTFSNLEIPVLQEDRQTEDTDAAFFDADGDGDADLYIVRGGNEVPSGDPMLADRLLFNMGEGVFTPGGTGSLPYIASNGSCVNPADFDDDGDLDLFVGSRSLPGAYGSVPDQYLLENRGDGKFQDVADTRARGLQKAGMVTDACWMDYDLDGDADLVVVGEWMNVTVFRNDQGFFNDITDDAGLGETSGWWNCIKAADIDLDGDMDLIAGNLGLNSILKASLREPVEMYIYDFDNDGSPDPVICSHHEGRSYPVASLDQLAAQINGLKKKFPRYSDFGGKTVEEIFGRAKLEKSEYRKAVLFKSSVFLNNGEGFFEIHPLPGEAQFSPVRDIMIHDFTGDGLQDLVLVGNNYSVRPSFGRYDATYGWFLPGEPGNRFGVQRPVESGLIIKGDARRIHPVSIGNDNILVAAVNNGDILLFRY